jgi:hypothetical protein
MISCRALYAIGIFFTALTTAGLFFAQFPDHVDVLVLDAIVGYNMAITFYCHSEIDHAQAPAPPAP